MEKELQEKVDVSIQRIKTFEPKDGYFVAYSGGKDSTVLLELVKRAGVKYDVHYSVTTVDPPELVRFIISQFDTVIYAYHDGRQKRFRVVCGRMVSDETAGGNEIFFQIPEIPMRKLIVKKQMPPTRLMRYCCEELKECDGKGRITMTGVRWAESTNRKLTHGVANIQGKADATKELADDMGANYKLNKRGEVILNDDNDENRRMVEHCFRTQKTLVNPIVDWTDADVWDFIKSAGLPHCSLYDQGWNRLGCIGCPMATLKGQKRDFERWPAMKKMYLDAFAEMLEVRKAKGKTNATSEWWKDADGVMKWWMGYYIGVEKGQISIDDILSEVGT